MRFEVKRIKKRFAITPVKCIVGKDYLWLETYIVKTDSYGDKFTYCKICRPEN